MLNFRKLKQEYAPSVLKEGRSLHERGMVQAGKILSLTPQMVRISCRVQGGFEHIYNCIFEIDRKDSSTLEADCGCSSHTDCTHLSAALFHFEEKWNEILLAYSHIGDNSEKTLSLDSKSKNMLQETLEEAKSRAAEKRNKKQQKELLQEYLGAASLLAQSPYFIAEEDLQPDLTELVVLLHFHPQNMQQVEVQVALRLPYRSKPLVIVDIREFLDSVHYQEQIYLGTKRHFFTRDSFDSVSQQILDILTSYLGYVELRNEGTKNEGVQRSYTLTSEALGTLLAKVHTLSMAQTSPNMRGMDSSGDRTMLRLYCGTLEEPLKFSFQTAQVRVGLDYLKVPAPKILFNPQIILNDEKIITLEEARFFECISPGLFYQNTYYPFPAHIRRKHLRSLAKLREITIPEPLFGTFIENALPELMRIAKVPNQEMVDAFVTLPFTGKLKAECNLSYLDGQLEASLDFLYDEIRVPAAPSRLTAEMIAPFVTPQGILARNLAEEQRILTALFQDFAYHSAEGIFITKMDKKIVEFMTEIVPQYQSNIQFNCPDNLLDQFVYDNTTFELYLKESSRIDQYEVQLIVEGHLNGVSLDTLWDCLTARKTFIELAPRKVGKKKSDEPSRPQKILVLDLESLKPVVHLFDEIGLKILNNHKELRPLWSLVSLDMAQLTGLPIKFTLSPKLREIQEQMLGLRPLEPSPIPGTIQADLRPYQKEGVYWLEKLRYMHLNGILADDMGLGKTLQAIIALTQYKLAYPKSTSLVICPTSLVYNWQEEISKFHPQFRVLAVDGTPLQRKKLIAGTKNVDVIITSYSLLQKDIELYKTIPFGYVILDEAQHIKNRDTRNAKSVKMLQAEHRLILTGTPIENSLEELWSLFDFLMPGLLSSYDRFLEKYVRPPRTKQEGQPLNLLSKKTAPFILRRMKQDVIKDLPPVSHIVYHCHLSDPQRELYQSYAASAREELSQLVAREGFDKVQIHILATLTRLKQICCHPAIFAKETPESGDSSKYEMLMELLQTLIEGKHKTVIFSQYTRMLQIMRNDLEKQGIPFEYLDGTSKNRLSIVKKFNENEQIPVFLVSLKAGGSGLNLVGADTVIHYDMWWNPAVENQATDRVHRLGQKNSVSSYKLVTLGTVEEKIVEMQKRKANLVNQVVTNDEEALSKLTWNEVLELLQT